MTGTGIETILCLFLIEREGYIYYFYGKIIIYIYYDVTGCSLM